MRQVLVVDDELSKAPAAAEFRRRFAIGGVKFHFAPTEEAAFRRLAQDQSWSLVLLDMRFAGVGDDHGLEILHGLVEKHPALPVVVMSSRENPKALIRAWDLGARSYLVKWNDNPDFSGELAEKITRFSIYHPSSRILGESPQVEELRTLIQTVATYDVTVLIEGESGTGKELVAQELHELGARRSGPMISVNCAAVPPELAESALFGHRKGAFTGAVAEQRGAVEEAAGGIFFLDEIGELRLDLQAKLLRFLDRKIFTRVGETKERRADLRIIAATNRDLQEEIRAGRFRLDLFQRLNQFRLRVPALRERREDIPRLAEHFLELARNDRFKAVSGFSTPALDRMLEYDWPGNVRELRNAVLRAFMLTPTGEIALKALPPELQLPVGDSITAGKTSWPPGRAGDLARFQAEEAWAILKQVYREELPGGRRGAKKRAALRLGLNTVNGFGRKVEEIRQRVPELVTEIDDLLKDSLDSE